MRATVHRPDARRLERARAARVDDRVPRGDRALARDPDLVAEVARVAGARDERRVPEQVDVGEAVVLHPREIGAGEPLEELARSRTLQRERAELVGHVGDRDVEAGGARVEPARVALGRREPEMRVADARDRAVVDDLAARVAPRRVGHVAYRHLREIARDEPIEERVRVGPADVVFEQRRHVDQRARVADREVLAVLRELVRAPRPSAPPSAATGCPPCAPTYARGTAWS